MPDTAGAAPDAAHVVDYLSRYEERYGLPVRRPVRVRAVHRDGAGFRLVTDDGELRARAVVSATGTWSQPFRPALPGQREYRAGPS